MSAEITVSVCIANYNGIDVIEDCIRSVQNQIGDFSVEILIHDDASTDDSVSHIQKNYTDVQLIISETNVGFCIANNRMAALAKGQYLLLLNNDAALYPDGLTTLLDEANTLNKPAILTLPQYDATTGELVDRGCLLDPFYNPVPNLDPARSDVAMVIGACLWVPKAMWDEFCGFPEWFGSIAEDMYLCCRAQLAGYSVRALGTSGYRHWQGKSFGGNRVNSKRLKSTYKRRSLSEKNKTAVMVMTTPYLLLLILIPIHALILIIEGFVLSTLNGKPSLFAKIYYPSLRVMKDFMIGSLPLKRPRQPKINYQLKKWNAHRVWLPQKLILLVRHGIPELK